MVLVKYNAKNVYSCCGVRLIPGVNEVDSSLLKNALTVPLFKWRIDEGIIELCDAPKQKSKRGRPKKGAKDEHLLKLIPNIYDVKILKRYIATSENKDVVEAAKKQLKRIEDVPVSEENNDEAIK